jgi:hypothetical protein
MNWKFWNKEPNILDEPIDKILEELRQHDPNSEEFARNMKHLKKLTDLKSDTRKKMKVDPNTIALVAGNLLGILLIVAYEQKHAMTSKGLGFVKPKI